MRKCCYPSVPECFAPSSYYCADCRAWFCDGHAEAHAKEVHAMQDVKDALEARCNCHIKGDVYKAPELHTESCPWSLQSRRREQEDKELVEQLMAIAKRYNIVIWYRDHSKDQYEVCNATPVEPG